MAARILVGVTGGSGAAYARRLLRALVKAGAEIHLVVSPFGRAVAATELGTSEQLVPPVLGTASLTSHRHDDLYTPLASGSYPTDGMIICPCSCHTLGSIASGLGDNLITRAAHVHLKEGRPLLACVREMPLSRIDLQNMLRVAEAGGIICPASPAFYGRPRSVDDLVNSVVGRLLDLLGIANDLTVRWSGPEDAGLPDSAPDG
jgi:4-hydroxy-3-polyprenylbenzoate decarboxylase